MCGRIVQARNIEEYADSLGWPAASPLYAAEGEARFNVAPGSEALLMHQLDDQRHVLRMKWGYVSAWGREHGLKMALNARLDKARGVYWRSLWKRGRAIVPADGWYEWTGPKEERQPWYIHARSGAPLFLAGLVELRQEEKHQPGFVIVTDDAASGLLDVHDRRPVVLDAQEAALWLDTATSADQAEDMARHAVSDAEDFEWYQVSREVNRSRAQGAHLIAPLEGKA